MTFLLNAPEQFVEEMLDGLVGAYPHMIRRCPGGVVRAGAVTRDKVSVVVGGGSGHYPAFAGLVGAGLADGAVVGEVFTSPSASQVESVCREVDSGRGVLLIIGNYAGDVLNFGEALSNLEARGHDVRCVLVTDDIASDSAVSRRRGIAGDLFVFKIAGAASEAGLGLDEVEAVARRANAMVRTYGVAFAGCTLPGAVKPLFTVAAGQIALGLGIHGEAGVGNSPLRSADEIAIELTGKIISERPQADSGRIAVIVNGLGSVKYEELFVLWNGIRKRLTDLGLEAVRPEVGEFVTSLDMAGCSLSVAWLDDELEGFWAAPAAAVGFSRGAMSKAPLEPVTGAAGTSASAAGESVPASFDASPEQRAAAAQALRALQGILRVLLANQGYLGDLDAVAGDGDHGMGMVRGASAAVHAATSLHKAGAGPRPLLEAAGTAWADRAGGTSGALWGSGLRAFADALPVSGPVTALHVRDAFKAALEKITSSGGAKVGDKTLVDALAPFVQAFQDSLNVGVSLTGAWSQAAEAARGGAASTTALSARLGRARVLSARSVGSPDPGAMSLALALEAAGHAIHSAGPSDRDA